MLQIVSQSNSEIKISEPKTGFSTRLIGFLCTFIFGIVFSFIPTTIIIIESSKVGVLKINCDRIEPKQVSCQISKSQYFNLLQQKPFNYKLVNSAKYNVIKDTDSEGDIIYRYNFSLLTEYGEKVPFLSVNSTTASTVVESLNSFMQSKQESFNYVLDDRSSNDFVYEVFFFLFPLIFLMIGLVIIYISFSMLIDYEELYLDRYKRELKHIKKRLLGTKINNYLFNEVAKIDVLYATDSYSNISFIPRIIINTKLQFKLDAVTNCQVAINIANNLNRFVGLPEEEDPVVKK
ncbi:hypothetical protein HCU40_04700 [Pseudanabaena biceps]|nr:hypothetical protein [Pseudanabaena biceps]